MPAVCVIFFTDRVYRANSKVLINGLTSQVDLAGRQLSDYPTNWELPKHGEHNQHEWCLFKNASAPENSITPHWFVHFQRRDLPLIPPAAGTRPHAEQVFLVVINTTGFRSRKQAHQEHDVLQGRPRKLRKLGRAARSMG